MLVIFQIDFLDFSSAGNKSATSYQAENPGKNRQNGVSAGI
ncbi:hypothetical protein [Pseudomonas sp. Irchel 3A7]|nr:hypothetical protein [Pseudomonas sp. Irchel 3A7]